MENQNYTFFTFRGDYGIIDDIRKDYSVFEKRFDMWATISHLPLNVIHEELTVVLYDSTIDDLIKSYERYVSRKSYVISRDLRRKINTDIPQLFGFDTLTFSCTKCNWVGLGSETIDIGMSEYTLYDIGCPNCGSMRSMGHVMFNSEIGDYKLSVSERFVPRGQII